jgi:hypothetical protein
VYSGDSSYAGSTDSSQASPWPECFDVTVSKANPSTPTITNIPTNSINGGSFQPIVSTNGDGMTSVTSWTHSVCTVSGSTVNYVGIGTCTLTAHVAAGTNYGAADGNPQSFTVNPSTAQAPAFTGASSTSVTTGQPFTFSVTTTGNPTPAITLASGSTLPSGVALTDNGNGTATLAGDSSVSSGSYSFTLQAANTSGTVTQPFTLTVSSSQPSPPSGSGPCCTITRFTPTSGPVGTTVTITGTNLSTTYAVDFFGAQALVTSATATQVTVKVPANAMTGPITIETQEGAVTSIRPFKVTSAAISSITPMSAPVGAKVTIKGANLTKAQVSFNGRAATVKKDGATQIVVTVPSGATSGDITITTKMGSATSTQAFTVT